LALSMQTASIQPKVERKCSRFKIDAKTLMITEQVIDHEEHTVSEESYSTLMNQLSSGIISIADQNALPSLPGLETHRSIQPNQVLFQSMMPVPLSKARMLSRETATTVKRPPLKKILDKRPMQK